MHERLVLSKCLYSGCMRATTGQEECGRWFGAAGGSGCLQLFSAVISGFLLNLELTGSLGQRWRGKTSELEAEGAKHEREYIGIVVGFRSEFKVIECGRPFSWMLRPGRNVFRSKVNHSCINHRHPQLRTRSIAKHTEKPLLNLREHVGSASSSSSNFPASPRLNGFHGGGGTTQNAMYQLAGMT